MITGSIRQKRLNDIFNLVILPIVKQMSLYLVKDQDYVDQFLFETLTGYCDNFSTSMVTMLRAVDIPARWVKGYTAGNYVGTVGSDGAIYEVTNNNAHSWVEVFFPSQGWVPFEPTKGFEGFDNLSTYTQDEEKNQTASIIPNVHSARRGNASSIGRKATGKQKQSIRCEKGTFKMD